MSDPPRITRAHRELAALPSKLTLETTLALVDLAGGDAEYARRLWDEMPEARRVLANEQRGSA